jgi:hypothetical protein
MNIIQEKIVDVLSKYTSVENKDFLRTMVIYKMAQVAGSMRAHISYLKSESIPTNIYSLVLANSGFSKGKTLGFLNQKIFKKFRDKFCNVLMKEHPDRFMQALASKYETKYGTPKEDKFIELKTAFNNSSKFIYEFPISTIEGVRSLRQRLMLSGIGSTNMTVDEIGLMITNQSVQDTVIYGLETYDMGMSNNKLLKYNSELDMPYQVPNNMLLFGVYEGLFNGSKQEEVFIEFLKNGYARRMLFCVDNNVNAEEELKDPSKILEELKGGEFDEDIDYLSNIIENFCTEGNISKKIKVSDEMSIKIMEYENICIEKANKISKHDILKRTEMRHRYWKVLKLAGIYTFFSGFTDMSAKDIDDAIEVVEGSGESFTKLLNNDPNYVKLATFLCDNAGCEFTNSELCEKLYFYSKAKVHDKREMLDMALENAFRRGVLVERKAINGIELFSIKKLKSTDLGSMRISYSKDIATGFEPYTAKWESVYKAVTKEERYFTAHHFKDKHRISDNVIQGFNMLIIDIDKDLKIDTFKEIMADYKYLLYTTKRHTKESNRFRVIFPMNYTLDLDEKEYKVFMQNFFEWLPFDVDIACSDIARAWRTNSGEYFYNEGDLIDVTTFIPNTTNNINYKNNKNFKNTTNAQRWFLLHASSGNRNNMLLRYALMCYESVQDYNHIKHQVMELNDKFENPIAIREIEQTIMKTIERKIENGS